jgi:hypothetical protein
VFLPFLLRTSHPALVSNKFVNSRADPFFGQQGLYGQSRITLAFLTARALAFVIPQKMCALCIFFYRFLPH